MRFFTTALAIASLGFPSVALSAEFHVAPSGSDENSGTKDQPFQTIDRARLAAREFAGKEPVTVQLANGIYYLPETLVFSPEDSGSPEANVVYRAQNEGQAVLSGGMLLNVQWEPYRDGIFQAETPSGLEIDQLFIDGKRQRMARYPNYDPEKKAEPYQGFAEDAFSKERAEKWANPAGGYIHAMHSKRWGGYHYRITGKNEEGEVTYEGGWQNNRQMGMHPSFRMVENIFEELDAPGEWFHNSETNTIYYYPSSDVDLTQSKVEVVRLRHLVEFDGSEEKPVHNITLSGFRVVHAARTFMDTKEPMLRSDWTIYRGGAYKLTGTESIIISDTEFDQVGGNAIFVNEYNLDTLIKRCHIHDTGASGVCFVGDPNAVRNPLFEYGERNDLSKIDKTPGPKTNNYPTRGKVEDCLIHGIGRVERQPAGVQIMMASEITIRDTSIYDCARAGINIGDGRWGGHLIERVDVFDTVLETHDHGSFNSWGRDRFWVNAHLSVSQKAINEDPKLPFLDAVKTTIIRDSRWRCDHGWDIDLDDGSTNYDIYRNVMLGEGLKLREGFRRHVWNNIAPFGSLHPHVWFDKSGDQVYSNIWGTGHLPARMDRPYSDQVAVDYNFFISWDEAEKKVSEVLEWDENSISGKPQFLAPAEADYRVADSSPALSVGFENFPMDQFGVKKPSLRAIARTPEIPSFDYEKLVKRNAARAKAAADESAGSWADVQITNLSGQDFSAFGVSEEEAGVAVGKVPASTKAFAIGLQEGDVIQRVNDQEVKTVEQFLAAIEAAGDKKKDLKVIRNQQPKSLTVD